MSSIVNIFKINSLLETKYIQNIILFKKVKTRSYLLYIYYIYI